MLHAMPRRMPKEGRRSTAAPEGGEPASPLQVAPDAAEAGVAAVAGLDTPEAGMRAPALPAPSKIPEIGGPAGPEPTRYGDWERKGRCIDF